MHVEPKMCLPVSCNPPDGSRQHDAFPSENHVGVLAFCFSQNQDSLPFGVSFVGRVHIGEGRFTKLCKASLVNFAINNFERSCNMNNAESIQQPCCVSKSSWPKPIVCIQFHWQLPLYPAHKASSQVLILAMLFSHNALPWPYAAGLLSLVGKPMAFLARTTSIWTWSAAGSLSQR